VLRRFHAEGFERATVIGELTAGPAGVTVE
jgi:hypothetical protein